MNLPPNWRVTAIDPDQNGRMVCRRPPGTCDHVPRFPCPNCTPLDEPDPDQNERLDGTMARGMRTFTGGKP